MHSDRIAMTARTKRGRASGQRQEPQEAGEASGTRAISSSSSARQGIRQSARQRTAATPVSTRSATKIESSQPEDRSGISQSNDGDSDDDDFQPTTVNGNIAVVVDRSYKTPSKKRNAETSISTPRKGKQARTKDSSGENCVDSSKDEDMEEIIKAEAVVAAPPHISEQESDAESTTSIKYGMGDDDNYFDDEDEDDEGDWEEVLPSGRPPFAISIDLLPRPTYNPSSYPLNNRLQVAPNEADEEEEEEELSGPWMYNPVEIVFDKPIVETKK
ncbi:hypothetical protein BGW38_001581 [Lunasporangiospora selenospora]|uniref:Uncharacterized protein n=1 Tax=Lunasporangiospora selenospora TaxID=979761 RepID=A0A9P6FU56_9FUNG|nr:hypothetical protein BGW38_001581 [Lunasporangiospora selenospora]